MLICQVLVDLHGRIFSHFAHQGGGKQFDHFDRFWGRKLDRLKKKFKLDFYECLY